MDVERTIEFILEQQARFVTDLNEIRTVLLEVASAQQRTNAIVETLAERHVELAQSHRELVQRHLEVERTQQELAEKQKTTEENLNALILTMERHLTDHK
jgi:hypothetical protein